MKAEQKARKQEQKRTRRQRRHEVDRKRWQFVEAWKTTLVGCKVLKFSSFGRSPPSSVGRAQGPWSRARAPRWVSTSSSWTSWTSWTSSGLLLEANKQSLSGRDALSDDHGGIHPGGSWKGWRAEGTQHWLKAERVAVCQRDEHKI